MRNVHLLPQLVDKPCSREEGGQYEMREEDEEEGPLVDPNPDILALFCHYNDIYFHNKLLTCTVGWSSSRMTLCAGICKYTKGSCEIRLSEPLLKFRSSAELKETLLHEMIHAYLWLTDSNKDHEDHGPCFQKMMQAINGSQALDHQRPEGGYRITIYHQFSEEVNSYRKHHWKCMRCADLIKRAHNRAPSQADCYQKIGRGHACTNEHCHWHNHQQHCGGDYEKIAEPEGYKDRRLKSRRYAAGNKAVEEEEARSKKKKDAVGYTIGDKIKNREDNMSGRTQRSTSLEMYFSTNRNGAREKLVTTTKTEDTGEICRDNLRGGKIERKRAKNGRREYKGDETEDDDLYLTLDGWQSDGANSFQRATVQKDKCTVIIGWKGWYACEWEEDENNMKTLDNKRSQRRMFERAGCQIQNPLLRVSSIQGPVSGKVGEINVLHDSTPRQSLLEGGDFGSSMPFDPLLDRHFATCSSTMLLHTERAENPSFSYALEKESPGEPSTSTIACENFSVVVSSLQETLASQTSLIESGDCMTNGFADIKESKTVSLDKDGHKMLVMEGRCGQEDDMRVEIGERVGGKIKCKGRSRRLRKGEGVSIERGPSAVCPICQRILSGDIEDANFNSKFNEHIDTCMGTLGS